MASADSTSTGLSSQPPPLRARRRGRRWLMILGIVLLVVVLLILLLPTLISTGLGTRWAVSFINRSVDGEVQVGDLSIGWFSGPSLRDVRLLDPQGQPVVDVQSIAAPRLSLIRLATGGTQWGAVTIVNRTASLVQYADGSTNLSRALASPSAPSTPAAKSTTPMTIPAATTFDLSLKSGPVSVVSASGDKVDLPSLEVTASAADLRHIQASVRADIRGSTGNPGRVEFDASLDNIVTAEGVPQIDKAAIDADGRVQSLPLALVDVLGRLDGRAVALVGPMLSGEVQVKGSLGGNIDATIRADSANLKAALGVTLEAGRFEARPGSSVNLRVQPAAWEALAAKPGVAPAARLTEPFDVAVALDQIKGRMDAGSLHIASLTAEAGFTVGRISLSTGPNAPPMAMDGSRGRLRFSGADGGVLDVTLESSAVYAGRPGKFGLVAKVSGIIASDGSFSPAQATASVNGRIEQWPLVVADELGNTGGMVVAALGPTLDAQMTADLKPQADGTVGGRFRVSVKSAYLNGAVAGQVASRAVKLEPDQGVELEVQPALAAKFLPATGGMALVQPMKVRLALSSVTLDTTRPGVTGLAAKAAIHVPSALVRGVPVLDQTAIGGLVLNVALDGASNALAITGGAEISSGQRTANLGLDAKLAGMFNAVGGIAPGAATGTVRVGLADVPESWIDQASGVKGLGIAAGSPLNVGVTVNLSPSPGAMMPQAAVFVGLTSRSMTVRLDAAQADGAWTVTGGDVPRMVLTPEGFHALKTASPALSRSMGSLALARPVTLTLPKLVVKVPTGADGWKSAAVSARAALDTIALAGDARWADVSLRDVTADVNTTSLTQAMTLSVNTRVQQGAQAGTLDFTADVKTPLVADRTYRARVGGEGIPLALVDALTGPDLRLSDLVGARVESITATAGNDRAADRGMDWAFTARTEAAAADLQGTRNPDGSLAMTRPGVVSLALSPRGFEAIRRFMDRGGEAASSSLAGLSLDKPAEVRVTVDQLALPMAPARNGQPARMAWSEARVTASLKAPATVFVSRTRGERVSVNNLDMSITAPRLGEQLTVLLGAATAFTPSSGQSLAGTIRSNTTASHLFAADGSVNRKTMSIVTDTQATGLPVGLLDDLAGQKGKLLGVLGRSAAVTAKGRFTGGTGGELDLMIDSPNTKGAIPASINKDLVVTLRADSKVTTLLTPEVAQSLGLTNPILASVSSDKPVDLTLRQETFRMAMSPFSLAGVSADVEMTMGTVTMTNGSMTQPVVGLMSQLTGSSPVSETFRAALTPLKLSMRDGVVSSNDLWLETTDLVPGRMIAMGTKVDRVNLATNEGVIRLGISGTMLSQIRELREVFEPGYVYELSMSGPLNRMRPDLGKFVADVALLKARNLAGKELKGDLGSLVGALTQLVDLVPQGRQQSRIQRDWPNRPTKLPASLVPATQPSGSGAAPGATSPPPTSASPAPAPSQEPPAPTTQPSPRETREERLRRALEGLLR